MNNKSIYLPNRDCGFRFAHHPTSEEIFDFIDKAGYTESEMFFTLRVFIANEYDRDPTILERLKEFFKILKDADNDIKNEAR